MPSQPPDLAWMCWLCKKQILNCPWQKKSVKISIFFSHYLENLCWTFPNHLLILNDCVDHITVTEIDNESKTHIILKFARKILKFVLILWVFSHYFENICSTFLLNLKFFVGNFLYITVTRIKIWNNQTKNSNSTFQI